MKNSISISDVTEFLKSYDGDPLSFMEVCGTHTAAISENGIPSLLSDKIRLISGPGCPVCVTVASYIDRLCELAMSENTCVVTFGDMIRVPGSEKSLQNVKALGGQIEMVYSPFEIIELAEKNPETTFVFAAVGFETTTPIYAVLMDKIIDKNINNIKLLTALKTMPNAIDTLCGMGCKVDGFIAPGHVSVITGAAAFQPLAEKYQLPFVVSGFEGKELLASIYALVKLKGKSKVLNLYKSAVSDDGNIKAQKLVEKYFEPCDAGWRGIGNIKNSGMALKEKYKKYDAGSKELVNDNMKNSHCSCGEVITGFKSPRECSLFGKACTPENPQGACMVSNEGACFHYFINNRG
ncbi:MAG: hydrogenase formation protein HypD [Acetobacter sp.]|nr:hydrogenase formation protein HypD [Bacteroides sp.]MCM1341165.1 hydrogenase formation protein HypD [Acetobacter sp.]MCM1433501.1 hydrogenase formation protein HypD [Clostridiales bacterium]